MKRLINFLKIKEDYKDPIYVNRKIEFFQHFFKDKDILKDLKGETIITTLFKNILAYINVNEEILFNQNLYPIVSSIQRDNYREKRVIDFLKDNDGYIIENYNFYFNLNLKQLDWLLEMYTNVTNYSEYSYTSINSKILYMYIINMVYMYDTIFKNYNSTKE